MVDCFHQYSYYTAVKWFARVKLLMKQHQLQSPSSSTQPLDGELGCLLLQVITSTTSNKIQCGSCQNRFINSFTYCQCGHRLPRNKGLKSSEASVLEDFLSGNLPVRYRYPGPVIYWLHHSATFNPSVQESNHGTAIAGNRSNDGNGSRQRQSQGLPHYNPMWPIIKGLMLISNIGLSRSASLQDAKISMRICNLLLLNEHELKVSCSFDKIVVGREMYQSSGSNNPNPNPTPTMYYPPVLTYLHSLIATSTRGYMWENRLKVMKRVMKLLLGRCKDGNSNNNSNSGGNSGNSNSRGVSGSTKKLLSMTEINNELQLLTQDWLLTPAYSMSRRNTIRSRDDTTLILRWQKEFMLDCLSVALEDTDVCVESKAKLSDDYAVLKQKLQSMEMNAPYGGGDGDNSDSDDDEKCGVVSAGGDNIGGVKGLMEEDSYDPCVMDGYLVSI